MMPTTDYDTGRIEAEWAAFRASLVAECECGGEITDPQAFGLCELCEADAAEEDHAELLAEDYYRGES